MDLSQLHDQLIDAKHFAHSMTPAQLKALQYRLQEVLQVVQNEIHSRAQADSHER